MKLNSHAIANDWTGLYTSKGRIHIPNVLADESAKEVYKSLSEQEKWNLVFQRNHVHTDIDADSVLLWNDAQTADFNSIVHSQAESGFQYLNKAIPIYDVYHKNLLPGHFFNSIFEFLNSESFLNFCRVVTDSPDIGFADAQATCYSAGHFLNVHDDNVQGKDRVAAYVLNMTPHWDTNWGGALQFIGDDGHIEEAFSPKFNALNIFRVPKPHAVSYVAPFATESRFSITGWLRRGKDPGG
ncbi:MAG: 2OG-Fe(II) oxygenase family protein [Pseudomonadales bacterium]